MDCDSSTRITIFQSYWLWWNYCWKSYDLNLGKSTTTSTTAGSSKINTSTTTATSILPKGLHVVPSYVVGLFFHIAQTKQSSSIRLIMWQLGCDVKFSNNYEHFSIIVQGIHHIMGKCVSCFCTGEYSGFSCYRIASTNASVCSVSPNTCFPVCKEVNVFNLILTLYGLF